MKNLKKEFWTTFIIGAVLLTAIVIVTNIIFDHINPGRFDLTANQIYKLSPAVKKIFAKLEAPIDVTYYVSSSEKMPTKWKNLERDVIDKLKELKLASNGKLKFTVFDPSAEEEKEAYQAQKAKEQQKKKDVIEAKTKPKITRKKIAERLYEKGVIPFGVQSADRDEFAVKRVYSSLVLSYLDRKEDVIPEVRPETFGSLEYEIMSRIYKLISNKRPKIGFYPGKPEPQPQYQQYYQQQPQDMYNSAVELLQQNGYDVKRTNIKKDDPIPDDIQTMVLMIDQPLEERQLYEIDKLVHNGVRIIMAAQQYNYRIGPSRQNPGAFDLSGMPTRVNISSLTKNYGFEFDNKIFMDKSTAYIQVPVYQTRNMGIFQVRQQRYEPVTKPVIIKVSNENINKDVSISNKIGELFYMYGTRLLVHDDILKKNNLKYRTLFTSSNFSWTREGYGYGAIDETPPSEEDVLRHQPLGILVEGKFKSKYAGGIIPKWRKQPGSEDKGEAEPDSLPSEITGEAKENKIIATGCSNMFKNDVLGAVMGHKALLLNCVDALTLGDELINIRSKNIVTRRIEATSSMGKAVAKLFVVWFPPLIFIALGIVINIRRKAKK
ncbi:MAG: GldG family protein [Calditrichaeota bacterium]|nr:GldG family protein [Calditrichota bacterium]